MIIPANTSVHEMSNTMLQLILEDIEAEMHRRKIEKAKSEMTKVWQAIENFQKNAFKNVVLVDCDENEIQISEISEIYDYENDCGFTFGPWTDENEPLTL